MKAKCADEVTWASQLIAASRPARTDRQRLADVRRHLTYTPRIFVHAPFRPDPIRTAVKAEILEAIKQEGLAPQEFGVSGLPSGSEWSFDRSINLMRQCDAALIIALARLTDASGRPMPSEFSHFEGALSLSRGLPTLVVAEDEMEPRGILSRVGRNVVATVPISDYEAWISQQTFRNHVAMKEWLKQVRSRKDVFFGYSSAAKELARNIKQHLESANLTVVDWSDDFRKSHTILEEVQRAAAECRCGLFLLTADDRLAWSRVALPRDNVLLEAGFFLSSAGRSRTILIREKGAKIPSDLDGIIYETIDRRSNWKPAADRVASTIAHRLEGELP